MPCQRCNIRIVLIWFEAEPVLKSNSECEDKVYRSPAKQISIFTSNERQALTALREGLSWHSLPLVPRC